MDRSEDPGRWLFIGLCMGALMILIAWGFQAFVPIDAECIGDCLSIRDLSAQESMARAAWGMILVTFISAALGAWSLYLIRENLVETRRLAQDAGRSAKAAEDAVSEAQRTSAIAREMAMAQIRAYLAVTGARCTPGRTTLVDLNIANAGQSPAREVLINAQSTFHTADTARVFATCPSMRSVADISSGSTATVHLTFSGVLSEGEARKVYNEQGAFIQISGVMQYIDVFDIRRSDNFKFFVFAKAGQLDSLALSRDFGVLDVLEPAQP